VHSEIIQVPLIVQRVKQQLFHNK